MASVNFAELPDEMVPKFSELMRAAVERNLYRTDNMVPGEMRAVMRVDENTGGRRFANGSGRRVLYGTRFTATATAAA